MALTKITSTNIQPGAIESSALELSGAAAGTYGSSSQVPVLSVNAQGIVYAISTTAVAGVDDFTWNGTNETLTIDTSDGSSYTVDISEMASETYVDTAISNLIGGAPAALDTLNELAAAINDDASYAASITTSLGTKVDKINITGATVGSSTAIPVLTFNAQGQITSASTTTVAGIDDVTFTNGTLTISAGDGTDYTTDLDARYFTETEANANFLGINAKAADADLFDGLNSTQFLRSDADDTMSGSLRINTGTYKNIDIKPLAHQTVSDMGVGLTFSRTTSDAPLMALGVVESDRLGLMSRSGIKFLVGATNNYEYTSEAMFIDPDGKVGIGETSPISKLDVVAGNSTAGDSGSMVSIKSAAGNTVNKLNLGTSSTGDYAWIQSVKPGSDVKSLAINPNGGNVGIGTATPSVKLDVNGDAKVQGNLFLGTGPDATQNFIAFRGTTGDDQTAYSTTMIGERYYSPTEGSELVLYKGNDGGVGHVGKLDRIRHIAAEHRFQVYTQSLINYPTDLDGVVGQSGISPAITITGDGDLYFDKGSDPRIYAGAGVGLNIDGQALYLNRNTSSNIAMAEGGGTVFIGTASVPGNTNFTDGSDRLILGSGFIRGSGYNVGNFSTTNWATLGTGGPTDGLFTRAEGQCYISVDDLFRIRDNTSATTENKRFEFNTDTGSAGADATWNSNSFDFAEMFEWHDGNPDEEDRIGYSVSLVEGTGKIKIAEPGEVPIGIISGTAGFVGDSGFIGWSQMYMTDEWGRPEYEYLYNEDGTPQLNKYGNPARTKKINPDYNTDFEYVQRKDRPEWDVVGLLGKVYLRKGMPVNPNWIKLKEIDESKDIWLIK